MSTDTRWEHWYREHGPQRRHTATPGLSARPAPGEIEYSDGRVARLADLFGPPRPSWREATDGTLRAVSGPERHAPPEEALMTQDTSTGARTAPRVADRGHTPEPLRLVLMLPTPLLTINWRRRQHWLVQARETKRQRQDAGWQLRATATGFGAARVRVDVEVRPRPGMKRPDPSALWEALKPTFDALEDRGIVDNDRQLVHGALVWSARRTGEIILTLTQEEG